MMEPTDNAIHAGCLGNINATWTFTGRAGHSARPWDGDNAIHKAARGIAALAGHEPEEHDFDGLKFYEVVSTTMIEGGIATNVVPDLRDRAGQLPLRARPHARGGRGAAARAARRPRRDRGHLQLPERARCRSATRTSSASQADLRDRAQAGVDAGGRVRPRGPGRDQLRPGRARAGAPARRVRARSTPSCAPTACWRRSRREALPHARRPAHVPVRAAHRGQAAPRGGRRGLRRLRDGRAARGDAAPSSARRSRPRSSRSRPTRRPTGCPELRAAIAGLGRAPLRRRRSTRTARSSPRSAPRRRSSTSPRWSAATSWPRRRPPTRSTSAAPRSPARSCSSCRWRPSAASCPTSTPSTPPPGSASACCG